MVTRIDRILESQLETLQKYEDDAAPHELPTERITLTMQKAPDRSHRCPSCGTDQAAAGRF